MTTEFGRAPRRRRHAAAGARVLAGGMSAAGTLALMGFMAGAPDTPALAAASAATRSPTPRVVVVERIVTAAAPVPAPAPRVQPANAPAVAASHGS
jgi:hypothetical protein